MGLDDKTINEILEKWVYGDGFIGESNKGIVVRELFERIKKLEGGNNGEL